MIIYILSSIGIKKITDSKGEVMDIKIKINTDNQAFAFDELHEVKRILQDNINKINTNDLVYLYDINGNKVGTIERDEV